MNETELRILPFCFSLGYKMDVTKLSNVSKCILNLNQLDVRETFMKSEIFVLNF